MKALFFSALMLALISCKKETTTSPTSTTNTPVSDGTGLESVSGNYLPGSLSYTATNDNLDQAKNISGAINYSVDVKYIGNSMLDFKINTPLIIPDYFKHFQLKVKSAGLPGYYTLDNTMFVDKDYNTITVNHIKDNVYGATTSVTFTWDKSTGKVLSGFNLVLVSDQTEFLTLGATVK